MANKSDVPYQSLMKVILADAVNKDNYLMKALSMSPINTNSINGAGLVMDTLPKSKKTSKK